MTEAARKALLADFIQFLKNEQGSRAGDDIEHVHDMRVATRRIRSIFELLNNYFKPKTVLAFDRPLRRLARALGAVRDLDVMIDNLTRFQATLPDDQQPALQGVIDLLDERRKAARESLVNELDRGDTHRFIEAFSKFVTRSGAGAIKTAQDNGSAPTPNEARYLLPVEVYAHLAAVRAYDSVIENAPVETLHMLRIEFKRLRYLISMFDEILGKSGKEFISELKAIQDHLGNLNDAVIAQANLRELMPQLDEAQAAALELYLQMLAAQEERLRGEFPEVWRRFNSKSVQRQLGNALAGL